jgi:hypothetical protein
MTEKINFLWWSYLYLFVCIFISGGNGSSAGYGNSGVEISSTTQILPGYFDFYLIILFASEFKNYFNILKCFF